MTPSLVHDYSAISTLAECPQKYDYRYNHRLEKFEPSAPLHSGQVMAEALHYLHTDGKDQWRALKAYKQLASKDLLQSGLQIAVDDVIRSHWGSFTAQGKHSYLSAQHLIDTLHWYMMERDPDQVLPLEESGIVLAEKATVFDWPVQRPDSSIDIQRVGGKPDIPAIVAGQRAIVDWKCSTQYINIWWAKKFSVIGHQLRIYMSMLRHAYGIKTECAYVDGIHIGKNANKGPSYWNTVKSVRSQLLGPFNFTESQLSETWDWINTWGKARELFEQEGNFPQNEGACTNYGGCEFSSLCGMSPAVRKARMLQEFKQWTPKGVLVSGADARE